MYEIACTGYFECLENSLLVVLLLLTISTTFTRSRHTVMEQFLASTLYSVDGRMLDDLYQIRSLSIKLVAFNIQFTIVFNKFEHTRITNKIQKVNTVQSDSSFITHNCALNATDYLTGP